ncbi:MAG: hypothetical protein GKR90_26820 [Pseudomonadales bacterium]|nr:hypothetical protein [Pseudomonadales bacterium]
MKLPGTGRFLKHHDENGTFNTKERREQLGRIAFAVGRMHAHAGYAQVDCYLNHFFEDDRGLCIVDLHRAVELLSDYDVKSVEANVRSMMKDITRLIWNPQGGKVRRADRYAMYAAYCDGVTGGKILVPANLKSSLVKSWRRQYLSSRPKTWMKAIEGILDLS